MAVHVFLPPDNPSFPYEVQPLPRWRFAGSQVLGYEVAEKRGDISPDEAQFALLGGEEFRDYFLSFMHGLDAGGPILWTPIDPVPSPTAPTGVEVDEVAGGALTARNYTLYFSWKSVADGTETKVGMGHAIAVSDSNLARLKVPVYPIGVDGFGVYASDGAGVDTELQATVQGTRVWTEPTGGLISGASPPTENDLTAQKRWMVESWSAPEKVEDNPGLWRGQIKLREVFI